VAPYLIAARWIAMLVLFCWQLESMPTTKPGGAIPSFDRLPRGLCSRANMSARPSMSSLELAGYLKLLIPKIIAHGGTK
jgi:hypothetical protein